MENPSKTEIDKVYSPQSIEEKWHKFWIDNGTFRANPESPAPAFSIVIPPPNVTGSLHIGHALNNTIQDILNRYHKMKGYSVLWIPGTDHAGIATQNVVERELRKGGVNREDLGREEFTRRVWKWKEDYGGRIINQLKKLGASCDWSRERFTLDEGLSRAVREVFVRLYGENLIYRGHYLVNWCPRCDTALSDLEVIKDETKGKLYYLRYPIVGGGGEFITVATTRPETVPGDTAVAVNPADGRFRRFIGQEALLPVANRKIPIIADESVDMEMGTGALKVTPAHDFADFETGCRHNLPRVQIMDFRGVMNEGAGKYAGMDRYECRRQILEDFEADGILDRAEDHTLALGKCYRCSTAVEPMLSLQWFVRMKPLAEPAISAVEDGRTRIIPEEWRSTYFEWMRNIRDWCISRQIWWGHRIPAWFCDDCAGITVSAQEPAVCGACGSGQIRQETDVLDTWFSSALWPFSTMGWPAGTAELQKFYPTSVLVTASDIIFFWVARMMMMGLKFMSDAPFRDVYIHALIRDEKGEKMSKTKGNVIDPLDIMSEFGADALRFSLTALAAQGRDIRLSIPIIEGYRNFMNKIWNASRFVFMSLSSDSEINRGIAEENLSTADKWILSKLNRTVGEVERAICGYEFDKAARAIYQFIWADFCDWYIELVKPVLYGDDRAAKGAAQAVLLKSLETAMKLLHPIAPFITEELYQKIGEYSPKTEREQSVAESEFPVFTEGAVFEDAFREIEFVKEVIAAIRSLRTVVGLHPSSPTNIHLVADNAAALRMAKSNETSILTLAKVSLLSLSASEKPKRAVSQVISGGLEVFLPVEGLIDAQKEAARIGRELSKLSKDREAAQGKLANADFLARAPEDVVEKERDRLDELEVRIRKMKEALEKLSEIG
ncbi:MAG: valine--tRNA ligase [Deltaproteobacteria bacterium]